MDIKVLGPGCPNCEKTFSVVQEALARAGVNASVEKVTDMMEIAKQGVLSTPAVMVDGRVKSSGKVPTQKEVLSWIDQG